MSKYKSKVTTSMQMSNDEEIKLFDSYFLKDGSMIIKEPNKKHQYYHFYYDKYGKHCSHLKYEKTNLKTSVNTNICEIRSDIIKKKQLLE